MPVSSKRHFIAGFGLAVLMLAAPLAQAQSKSVRMAWTPAADAPQVSVAIAGELWKAKGLDVSVVSFPSGREALEALIGGQADFAVIAEFPAATAALRKQPFAVLADMSRYKANRIITTTDVASMAALAGKRMGTTIGTNVQYQAETALAEAGATATMVNAGPADLLPTLQAQGSRRGRHVPDLLCPRQATAGRAIQGISDTGLPDPLPDGRLGEHREGSAGRREAVHRQGCSMRTRSWRRTPRPRSRPS